MKQHMVIYWKMSIVYVYVFGCNSLYYSME